MDGDLGELFESGCECIVKWRFHPENLMLLDYEHE